MFREKARRWALKGTDNDDDKLQKGDVNTDVASKGEEKPTALQAFDRIFLWG